ncbi:hypothetical protein ABZV91_02275 [Nocardia sp. NPDC004568]
MRVTGFDEPEGPEVPREFELSLRVADLLPADHASEAHHRLERGGL